MTLIPTYAIEASRLTKTSGEGHSAVHALRGVDLKILAGQVTFIIGPSGSGKKMRTHFRSTHVKNELLFHPLWANKNC